MLTKNIKTMLLLLLVAALCALVSGCEDPDGANTVTVTIDGEEFKITTTTEGNVEDWKVENLDNAIEKVAGPALDLGDDVVEVARETEKKVIKWFGKVDPRDDPNDFSIEGFFGTD